MSLQVDDPVVVYVPWQTRDGSQPLFGPYWEGTIIGISGDQIVVSKPGFEPCVFHQRWVYPEQLRGQIKLIGRGDKTRLQPTARAVQRGDR